MFYMYRWSYLWSNKMKQGFDEWFDENFEDILSSPSKYMLKFTFEAGAQSRQAEIEEIIETLKTSADSEKYLFDELQKVKKERDELQNIIENRKDDVNFAD